MQDEGGYPLPVTCWFPKIETLVLTRNKKLVTGNFSNH